MRHGRRGRARLTLLLDERPDAAPSVLKHVCATLWVFRPQRLIS